MNDEYYINILKEKISDKNITSSKKAYYERILRVYNMLDLTKVSWNPVNMVIEKLKDSKYFSSFEIFSSPEIVWEFETFDLFYFPEDHVARRPSDSYFIEKTSDKEKNILLRPHTTIMWYHYLNWNNWLEKLKNEWEIKILSYWKVYRVDELDKTHHECFHQVDWLKIIEKSKEIITQDSLKEALKEVIKSIYWNIEYRFNKDSFPYTTESLEVEVMQDWKWLEVTWAWVVKWEVLEKLWVDSSKYNGWAFWFWIERLAMALKKIPDIRIFWSKDKRVLSQWGNLDTPYKEISNFPPIYKDISLLVPKNKFIFEENEEELKLTRETESNFFAITWIIRDIWKDLIEEVKIIDNFENDKKFWNDFKSITISITFRSIERTLINEEINEMYFQIREKIENDLSYVLR